MNAETQRKIESNEWFGDAPGSFDELLATAEEAWDDAGAEPPRGPWEITVDCADLTKILRELKARREAEL